MSVNVYKEVTNRVIEQLENGVIPWEQPWVGCSEMAFNRVTKKTYSLLNQLLLGQPGEYATFKQWNELGGKIKKGEKASIVVFWKMLRKEIENEDGEMETKTTPILRYYYVFHISQVEGVEPLEKKEYPDVFVPDDDADGIIADYLAREKIDFENVEGDHSYYVPALDKVEVPKKEQFKSSEEYYSTVFHELIHSTGSAKRLNRLKDDEVAAFGSATYSKEELVAEIGAASIMNMLGMETDRSFRNTTAYIQSWLKVLKSDSRFIVSASSKASKAVEFILGKENSKKLEDKIEADREKDSKEVIETEDKKEEKPKAKRRSHDEILVDKMLKSAKKYAPKSGIKNPDGYCKFDFELDTFYGFTDCRRIIASKNDFGKKEMENPVKLAPMFEPMEFCGIDKMKHVDFDINEIKEFKKDIRKSDLAQFPYGFEVGKGKTIWVNPEYFVDMVDFMEGTTEFYYVDGKFNENGCYTNPIFFATNDGCGKTERLGLLLPVNKVRVD